MEITSFKYKDNDYTFLLRTPRSIVGYRRLDTCCVELYSQRASAPLPFILQGEKVSTVKILCNSLSSSIIEDASNIEKTNAGNLRLVLPDSQKSLALAPVEIQGTSGDTMYKNLVTVSSGTISYAHGKMVEADKKPPRVRVNKNDKYCQWPSLSINNKGTTWPAMSDIHLAHTGMNREDTRVLIALGLENLIKLTNLF